MPAKYYSVYNHRYAVTRNFTRKNKRKDSVAALQQLPIVRDSRNVLRVAVTGGNDDRASYGVRVKKKSHTLRDVLSGPPFRVVAGLMLVMVVLLYKSVYRDYLHPKNSQSPAPIAHPPWNSTKTARDNLLRRRFPDTHIYGKKQKRFSEIVYYGVVSFNRTVGGRGINVAVIEPTTYTTVAVQNFDTYEYNSSNLDEWLAYTVKNGDIVIFFTFDEASKKLTKNTRRILYNMGSGKIQDLGYRCQWYMVTQKGIQGITPYEKITYSQKSNWADVLDDKLCVPFQITGNPIVSDDLTNDHLSFCNATLPTSGAYVEFCGESNKQTTGNADYDYSKGQTRQNHRTTVNRSLENSKIKL